MMYRIYTERFAQDDSRFIAREDHATSIVSRLFESFTRFEGVGYWQGGRELSVCFEIITDDDKGVMAAARSIRRFNDQAAVLVVAIPCTITLVED